MRHSWIALALLCLMPANAQAEDWSQIGYGRLINNDFLGDLKDREQSGSYVASRIYAKSWSGALPGRAGEVLEFRLQADIKAPDNLVTPAVGDRPYAGSVTFGLHTHYQQAGMEISLGAEIVATGPQTRLDQFQTALHDGLGVAPPSAATLAGQIGNGFHPGAVIEMGRSFSLSNRTQLRPFVEGRAGAETLIRAGADLVIGQLTQGDLMVRDGITGQRYRTVTSEGNGVALIMGVDTAMVSESIYLPSAAGYTLSDTRDRARIGLHWENNRMHGFFGVTYLGREYTSQSSEQVVGSVRLALKF